MTTKNIPIVIVDSNISLTQNSSDWPGYDFDIRENRLNIITII